MLTAKSFLFLPYSLRSLTYCGFYVSLNVWNFAHKNIHKVHWIVSNQVKKIYVRTWLLLKKRVRTAQFVVINELNRAQRRRRCGNVDVGQSLSTNIFHYSRLSAPRQLDYFLRHWPRYAWIYIVLFLAYGCKTVYVFHEHIRLTKFSLAHANTYTRTHICGSERA